MSAPLGTAHASPSLRLSDYAFISDCHSSALVSRDGSIDWCCMPRIDSRSCFGRLLGWQDGGHCRIAPLAASRVRRRYWDDSLILETTFETETGSLRLTDLMPMRQGGRHDPYRQILRVVEGVEGEVVMLGEIVPRFDYGAIQPWIRGVGDGAFHAVGGADGLLLSSDLPFAIAGRHSLVCEARISRGQRRYLSIVYARPESLDDGLVTPPSAGEVVARLEATEQWWQSWAAQGRTLRFDNAQSQRSAVVLKGLIYAPTGAVTAAATTSLPEVLGGSRNWDYRFAWVRDSVFTVRSLLELGFAKEADGFRRFIERSTAGNADQIQVLYGVDGRRRLEESTISHLHGFNGSSPVRVGNAAAGQLQLDVYGELLYLAYAWHLQGHPPDAEYWEFVERIVERTIGMWRSPDQGLWEMRGAPRHFVHSKAMCWAAINWGLRLSDELGLDGGRRAAWRAERDAVRAAIEAQGYDQERGVFTQSFGSRAMDAALLLLPTTHLVSYHDERMIRTADAVLQDLTENGLLRRYPEDGDGDGLEGREGAFIACSFWLAECLARQGRRGEALEIYARALATRNDLGLFSEELQPSDGLMLGNFPQGLTHLSQIAAAVAIAEAEQAGR
jgi:GH15 family glucan-1,4-alpha-glucosidase